MASYHARRSSRHFSSHSGPVPGLTKNSSFHLLEFARAEGEVARVDLVAEGFADLRDAEGELLLRDVEDVLELDEQGLRGLGAEVSDGVFAFHGADIGFQHEVEDFWLGELRAVLGVEFGRVGYWSLVIIVGDYLVIFVPSSVVELTRNLIG